MEFSKRYLALGDSFTEGMGDEDPTRPNRVRGWADRVAEQLCADPEWGYANLAIRGKKIRQVVSEQLPVALELKPTLVSLYMGGNDILRPSVDIDALMQRYDEAVAKLAGTGAQLLLFTGFDSNGSAIFEKTRGRTAIYNEGVREIAEKHGAVIADYWRWREFQDWRYWAADRLHMGTPGHTLMAKKVLGVLEPRDRDRGSRASAAGRPDPRRKAARRCRVGQGVPGAVGQAPADGQVVGRQPERQVPGLRFAGTASRRSCAREQPGRHAAGLAP